MPFRIMISDKMSPDGLAYFTGHEGYEIVYDPEITMEALAERIGEFDALVIRSRTNVRRPMLANPGKLKIIGRAGAGVDNVDVEAATEKGIIVMNTPGGNTFSTAEHTISMMLSLARQIPQAHRTMKDGKWDKKSFMGVEMFEKTLGVVGLGKIGAEVASRMRAFGMDVLAYDPFLTQETAERMGVTMTDVDTICQRADVITVHCPLNEQTRGLIGAERLAMMKPTVLLVNCARGGIIDEQALFEALQAKKVAGAALDVFGAEPLPGDHPLRSLDNVVLTPHLAATTAEAQEKVARDIAIQIREALGGDTVRNAVNFPSVDSRTYAQIKPYLGLAERMGRFISQFARPTIERVEITYSGTMLELPQAPLTTELIKGFLAAQVSETTVNSVNAQYLAKQRGLKISEVRSNQSGEYTGLMTVTTTNQSGEVNTIAGAVYQGKPHLVQVNAKRVDVLPEGQLLVLENRDVPGIIGSVGTALGQKGVNIAAMTWGRTQPGGDALTVINVDQAVTPEVLQTLSELPSVLSARKISL